jgi:hypothetical protein
VGHHVSVFGGVAPLVPFLFRFNVKYRGRPNGMRRMKTDNRKFGRCVFIDA